MATKAPSTRPRSKGPYALRFGMHDASVIDVRTGAESRMYPIDQAGYLSRWLHERAQGYPVRRTEDYYADV